MRLKASQAHYKRTVGILLLYNYSSKQAGNREKSDEKVEDHFSNERNSKNIYSKSYLSKLYPKICGEHVIYTGK